MVIRHTKVYVDDLSLSLYDRLLLFVSIEREIADRQLAPKKKTTFLVGSASLGVAADGLSYLQP